MAKQPRKNDSGSPSSSREISNIIKEYNIARLGMDMDSSTAQIIKGKLSYALNAVVENFDANSINYQNEPGNIHCLDFPEDFVLIGKYFINEQYKHIFFLTNPLTKESQIGYMVNNDCKYHIIINDPCLGFNINSPIHKVVHKITNCSTEIYWTDNIARRYLDIDKPPMKLLSGTALCDPVYSKEIDCNRLKVQPNFTVPTIEVIKVSTGGDLISGTYQFAVQYSDANGNPLTSYYSITNPTPINDPFTVSVNYNTQVGKSITVLVENLDVSGLFGYFNLAVIKTINNISEPELVGTYSLPGASKEITYTGANKISTPLSIADIIEKFPYYEQADDITTARDVLIWKGLTTVDRINYQSVASEISLDWETHRIPATEDYSDELNATNLRGYLRDEVYPFEIVFILTNGRVTDGFHIPGREITFSESTQQDINTDNPDFIGDPDRMVGSTGYSPYWKIYNTATVERTSSGYVNTPSYKGPYQSGKFAYWESSEEYPCNEELWGDLAGKKIRHHKFPDVLVSPINESSIFTTSEGMVMEDNAVFPIGVKINLEQVYSLIKRSNLTQEQKDEITGIKIIRGNRGTNKSIIAKGILRNVGKYEREGQEYYFPNYPYNDISEDPFLNKINNAFSAQCLPYEVTLPSIPLSPLGLIDVRIVDCDTNKEDTLHLLGGETHIICSIGFPAIDGEGTVKLINYEIWKIASINTTRASGGWRAEWVNASGIVEQEWVEGWPTHSSYEIEVYPGTEPVCVDGCNNRDRFISDGPIRYVKGTSICGTETPLEAIEDLDSNRRLIFNSPETSFGQPFLGSILKLESVLFGRGKAHFVEVKKNAKYKLLTKEAQEDAIDSSKEIALITDPFNPIAFFTVYQAYLEIYINSATRRNFAYSYNSIASYNYNESVPNDLGIKQRNLDIKRYLIPGVQSVGEEITINNYNRESSVFIKTDEDTIALPFPKDTPNLPAGVEDISRIIISDNMGCEKPAEEKFISVVSYYASLKNLINNQWGQIYSYTSVDTGFQKSIKNFNQSFTIFGGDTFISRFAFKTKLPFFIDNRVNAPDDSDIFYDEIGNIGYPKYWHSARSILKDVVIPSIGTLPNFLSYKAHNFDCPNEQTSGTSVMQPDGLVSINSNPNRTFYNGYFYLFAYGIPNFYCESSYNLNLRQAFNNREGDFWPHVSTSIPDDWVQEDFVSILNDNTYTYNVTYSKQNKEDSFTNLPPDWSDKLCYTYFPFRAIYSDVSSSLILKDEAVETTNNWLIYRALSYFDFPQNYGKFVSIDGIQDKAILARFENKSLLYNNLLTIDTSNPQAVYLGNNRLFSEAPPIDIGADTDLGFVGTQNKMFLKIPNGQVTVDAKRGQIFLLAGQDAEIISKYGSGVNSFMKEHLPFKLLKHFPETKMNVDGEMITLPGVNIDNHFNGVGLHGVYDNRFDRIILTKIDYVPLLDTIKLDAGKQEFYIETIPGKISSKVIVSLTDPVYFCNKSFTISFNLNTRSWISFHSYIPNYYIAENNFFYSGQNDCCSGDFDFIAGNLIATPSTTTTTTVYRVICTPMLGTAVEQFVKNCTLTGIVTLPACNLTATGYIVYVPECLPFYGSAVDQQVTTTTTTTILPTVGCGELAQSGGFGVTEFSIPLETLGGVLILDFNALSVTDKMEIIHNGVKVATSGMSVANAGPFDNLYGNPTVPDSSQAGATDQFIGTSKGAIPTREAAFTADTGLVYVPTKQQLVWFTYSAGDVTTSPNAIIRITGITGTVWHFNRYCPPVTTTTTTTVEPTTTTTTTVEPTTTTTTTV